jgi:heme/copper-type cytochrome/quinol oxidase subunit 1
VVVLVAAIGATVMFGQLVILVAAAAMLVIGVAAAYILVPISKGARSLAWSRLADVFEWLAVVLSFPAALLAADVLTVVRGMMSS